MAILSLEKVSKSYGDSRILKDVNLEVEEGEFIAIVGFSGSGKTTLMNILTGLELPDKGRALYKGAPISEPDPERGLVFQSYSLMPWLTVNGNVALAVDSVHKEKSKEERATIVKKYVDMVGLSHAVDRRPAELSGGMRQRVSVARALAMQPEVLLLDEPLSALDALTRANLQDEIEAISQKEKKTIILITNDVDEAILLADRIIPLNPGPNANFGPDFKVNIPRPRERSKMNDNKEFIALRADVTKYLMDVGFASASSRNRVLPDVTAVHHMRPAVVRDAGKSLGFNDDRYLQFSQVHKVYPTPKGPLTVVEDFDLTMKKGEFISIIGHSGCGKSTALTMVAGLNEISKGGIILDGTHVEGADPERAVVFQAPSLFPWLSAKENVAIGVDKVYPKATQAERQEVVEYYLERVGLADAMDKSAADLSNGMKQRVGIARAFALSPKLLLLDEPFGMLDSLTRWELQEVLMDVWSRTKVTAICVTHDVDEAVLLSDRVVMMTNGPRATIGKIMEVDLPRPRSRKALLEHPDYYKYRAEVLQFLEDYEHGDPVEKKEQVAPQPVEAAQEKATVEEGLTEAKINMIQASFAKVAPISDAAAQIFYDRLFEVAPEVKPMFKGPIEDQGKKLMTTLGVVVNSLKDLDKIIPVAGNLAVNHVGYGVRPDHYPIVGECLIYTLHQGLGDDMTPELEEAWATAFDTLSSAMIAAAYGDSSSGRAA